MASNYDFRILIDTVSGSKHSYGTGSLVSLATNTSVVLDTNEVVDRINTMATMSYYNGETHTSASSLFTSKGSGLFGNTNIDGSGTDYQFLSASIKGNVTSGSIVFHANSTSDAVGDYIKRYKFFGNKVCNVLGVPENYWIYADKFRLTNTGSEQNYISGDVLAHSIHLRDNFAISNAGSITSDLPMKHAENTDRWIKWQNVSGSLPQNDMLIGYGNQSNKYMIRMQNNNDLIISSSITDFVGNITSSNISVANNIVHKGDTDTSINFSSNQILFNAGSSTLDKMRITSTGIVINEDSQDYDFRVESNGDVNMLFVDGGSNRVGIGTGSPQSRLHIENANTTEDNIQNTLTNYHLLLKNLTDTSGSFAGIAFDISTEHDVDAIGAAIKAVSDNSFTTVHDANLTFHTNDDADDDLTERMRITHDGNIGIGTTSPVNKLQVEGGISASGDLNIRDGIFSRDGVAKVEIIGVNGTGGIVGTDTNHDLLLRTNNTERVRIDTSGNVGIGGMAPQELLHIQSDSDPTLVISSTTVNTTGSGKISFREGGSNTERINLRYDGHANKFIIDTEGQSDALTILRSSGNVGIGTNAPGSKLQVLGDVRAMSYGGIEIDTGNNVQYFKLGTIAGDGARVVCEAIGQNTFNEPGTLITTGIFSIGNADNEYAATQSSKGDYPVADKEPTFIFKDAGTDTSIDVYIKCGTFFRGSVFIKEGYGFTLNAAAATAVSNPSGTDASKAGQLSGTYFMDIKKLGAHGSILGLAEEFFGFEISSSQTGSPNANEVSRVFTVPFDGFVRRVMCRAQKAPGSTVVRLYSASNTVDFDSVDDSGNRMVDAGVTVDMDAADTSFIFEFDTVDGGDYSFSAGDILALSVDVTDDQDDFHATLVLMYKGV